MMVIYLLFDFISHIYSECYNVISILKYFFQSLLSSLITVGIVYVLRKLITYYYSIQLIQLNDKFVVITGADSGLGLETVSTLAAKDIKVIALTLTDDGSKLASKKGALYTIQCDLTVDNEIKKATEQIGQICNHKLWAVVHNAGIVKAGFIDFQPIKNYRDCMEVNFFGIVSLNQRLLPMIKNAAAYEGKLLKSCDTAATASRVVIVTSVDGIVSLPGNAPYDASKFAAEAYADALRVEMSFWNVHVSVINPSTMRTPLALSFFETQRATWNAMLKVDPNGNWQKEWTKEWLELHIKTNSLNINSIAENPAVTVKDIVHAVIGKYPEFRYLSGTAAKTLFYLLWILPERMSYVIKKGIINPPPTVVH